MDLEHFKKQLQYLIINGLKPVKRKTISKGKILVNQSVFRSLKEIGIRGRFSRNDSFIDNLQMTLRRNIDDFQYCECRPSSFQVRVGRTRTLKSNNKLYESGSFIFAFQFVRFEVVQQTPVE